MNIKRTSIVVLLMLAVLASGATAVAVAQEEDPPGFPANFYGNATDGDGIDAPVGTEIYAVVTDNGDRTDVSSITVDEAGQYGGPDSTEDETLSVDSSAGDTVRFYIDDPDNGAEASQSFDLESEGDGTYNVDLTFSDAEFDINSISITLGSTTLEPGDTTEATVTAERDSGSDDVTDQATITSTDGGVASVDGSTITAEDTGDATIEAELRGQTASVDVSVVDDADEETDDDGDDGGGGGGAGGAGTGGQDGGEGDDAPPTVTEVRNTLDLVDPSTTTRTEIADNDPDTPGTQITPEGTESVRSISFEAEGLEGNVDINEYNNPPQQIRNDVASSVTAAGAAPEGSSINTISVADITPDNEAAEDSAATVEFAVPASEVDNPDQLTVFKETYSQELQEDTWTELDTSVDNVGDEEITVSADAESFSLFAVSEVEPADGGDGGQQDDGQDDEQQPDDGGLPTSAIVIGLLVVVAIAGAALYARSNN